MKRKVCACGVKSVPGLIPGVFLCQKHFDGLFYKSGPAHLEAIRMLKTKPPRGPT